MRIVILAGSGLSIGAGYPSTKTLTEKVLSGGGVSRHTDSSYYIAGGGDPAGSAAVSLIVAFLQRLAELVSAYYSDRPGRTVNYEDLAYVVGQFLDSRSGEFDNPALGPLHDALVPVIEGILPHAPERKLSDEEDEGGQPDETEQWGVDDLAREARNYIADVVWRSLAERRPCDYLRPFIDLVRDERLEDVSLFTLNHDTLLERMLREAGVAFEDGFGDPVNDVRYWDPGRFEEPGRSRRLVKLHGSVDCFLLRPDDGEFHEERVGQVLGDDSWGTREPDGRRRQTPVDGRPLLLVGTHNKARRYLNPPFFDAHVEFYRRLNRGRATALLVVGYGGQDKAINERIADWMESDLAYRLVIVNRTDGILEQARGALRGIERSTFWGPKGFPRWREQDRFVLIDRPFETVTITDYVAALRLAGKPSVSATPPGPLATGPPSGGFLNRVPRVRPTPEPPRPM